MISVIAKLNQSINVKNWETPSTRHIVLLIVSDNEKQFLSLIPTNIFSNLVNYLWRNVSIENIRVIIKHMKNIELYTAMEQARKRLF